jgi:N-acetylglutamate synthase-like GNAT family acetyltransferase
MPYSLRPAVSSDQPTIVALIHEVGINPMNLDWPRFIVAVEDGRVIGCGQVKPHRDCRELASIAVRPERQAQGVGSAIVQALLAREAGPLYLTCQRHRQGYYERFGFARIGWGDLPGSFRPLYVIGTALTRLIPVDRRLTIMRKG